MLYARKFKSVECMFYISILYENIACTYKSSKARNFFLRRNPEREETRGLAQLKKFNIEQVIQESSHSYN